MILTLAEYGSVLVELLPGGFLVGLGFWLLGRALLGGRRDGGGV